MKLFLKNLKLYAQRYLNKNETNELVNYYEEMINERLLNGENIEDITNEYNIEEIVKESLPDFILKRNDRVFKNSYLVLLLLFSMPLLLPFALTYLAILIVLLSILVSFAIVSVSGILFIIPYMVETLKYATSIDQVLGFTAIGLIISASIFYIGYLLATLDYMFLKWNIKVFLNIFIKKRGQHEAY